MALAVSFVGLAAVTGLALESGGVAVLETRAPDGTPRATRVWVAEEDGKPVPIGSGQHGGWGPDETRPFLMVNDGGRTTGRVPRPTSLTDIAPTIARFLGLPVDGFDGSPLPLT